ncbi:Transcription factor IIA (TFIIA), beta-barrel [Glarea lozoyensis ATCC 20868]|uniref:Transcription initiation factor IIA large subunit n=1 Tax=Glarea lozoyensis (strain ATCC 20868 / MF5171) TaxID=1116229 RepID=S3DCK5_GLAL2|nr:Transcription factor IIA (TFIIA), beta-barrel [Glarea lozoyensis ATCC 20868]EPE35465.1 Transcription factor IIA (TFIIA), beta-barrel [Glarea lozoyensis ATCC 20868]
MSNAQVGNVYSQIIGDVIESSRVDFEEGGVDEAVLEELKTVWQNKLSSLNVATFPWDPKPEPPQAVVQPPTLPSNAGNYMSAPPHGVQPQMQQMPPLQNPNGPRIKTEPGLENSNIGMSQAPYQNPVLAMPNATTAQQRAAQHLQNSYGQRAAASINAIQGSAPPQAGQPGMQMTQQQQQAMQQQQHRQMQMQQQQQQAQRGGQMPPQLQSNRGPAPTMTQEQYRQAMAAQAQQKLQSQGVVNGQNPQMPNVQNGQGQSSLAGAQVDGGDDEVESVGLVKQLNENGEETIMGRFEIDGMIRQKIEAMGQKMEGGGLMLPLKQASTASKRQRKVKKSELSGQHDGAGSDDDLKEEDIDEDAINSDLDDPDDGLNEEDDDEDSNSHIMLCMYDKVQRVKNKWKCVMKDGVLTVNGKEYVFHKAQGEYEW